MKSKLLLSAVAFGIFAPPAQAGYPVQPFDGAELNTKTPTFLVYRDRDEILPRVQVARDPYVSPYGNMLNGYIGSCLPYTAFSEANKFTCQLPYSLDEGTYFWVYTYEKYECRMVDYGFGPFRSCGYELRVGPAWRFTIRLAAAPTADVNRSLPTVARPTSYSRVDPNYSSIASQIADISVDVQCWSRADWNKLHEEWRAYEGDRGGGREGLSNTLGYVRPGAPQFINLAPDVCSRLDLLLYKGKRPKAPVTQFEVARAVVTLTHEAIHSYGIEDESLAQCFGMQFVAPVATSLGTNARYARQLAAILWFKDWPTWAGTEYYTAECYDGGPLDLRPASALWP